jgi:hypothetical protein
MWEWFKRGGDCQLYRPVYWHRVGIPGSGQDDWFRADVEYCMCFKRPGKLHWSDNTACGHIPKWAPGGEMSHRLSDGSRVNQWGPVGGPRGGGGRNADGSSKPSKLKANAENGYPSRKVRYNKGQKIDLGWKRHTKRDAGEKSNGEALRQQVYLPPVLANPGNLFDGFRTLKSIDILAVYAIRESKVSGEILRDLHKAITSKNLRRWWAGMCARVLGSEVLRQEMQGLVASASERPENGRPSTSGQEDCPANDQEDKMRGLWEHQEARGSPHKRGRDGQQPEQSRGSVSPKASQAYRMQRSELSKAISGQEILRQALSEMEEIRRSVDEVQSTLGTAEGGNLISIPVGGRLMGHALSCANEAPYSEALCEFFIKSLCPPDVCTACGMSQCKCEWFQPKSGVPQSVLNMVRSKAKLSPWRTSFASNAE